MNKAKEFGVTAKMTSQGIDISGFKTQAGMDKFMKYIASQGKNMINLAKMGMKRNFEDIQEADINVDNVKKDDSEKEKELKIKLDKEKDQDALEKQLIAAQGQINILKQKLENEKNKAVKPMPNPETGEIPLTIGLAHKLLNDKEKKEKEVKENVSEKAMTDREKRIQRAKDMIKYYDAQKKAALKGKNKDLAKKMLKNELEEATVVSDISGISIPALKRETAKFNIKVARVTPGGPMGAEYEVTFTGAEKDLIAYAKEHFGFDDKPGTFQQLKKHLNMDYVPESVSQVQTRSDGKGNFNLMYRGKEIGYYHREGGKYVVYYDKDGDDYDQSDEVSTTSQAKKLAYDNMNEEVTAVYTDKKTRQVKSKKFKDVNTAKDYFRKTGEAAGQINFREADLTKSQIKQVHKVADDLPKKDFKDRYGKEKGDAVRFGTATNMVKKKLGMREDRRLYVETIAGLKKKAEKSGMPYSILKKVYDRGMAAWKSGHRPGASQQQWAFARVNSFITKSSGTWGGADKDLAKQVKG